MAPPIAETRLIATHAGEVRVRVLGSGPTLLFVHGALVDGSLWDDLASALAPHFCCLLPDLPFGSQPVQLDESADLSVDGVGRLLLEIAAAFDTERPTVVANNSGGALCQLIAASRPGCFERIVLTNCDALEVFPPKAYALLMFAARRPWLMRWAARLLHRLPSVALAMRGGYGALARNLDEARVARWTRALARHRTTAAHLARVFGQLSARDTLSAAERLAHDDTPIHLVWGAADPFFTLELAERFQSKVGATLDVIDAGRTYVMLDEPEAVARAIGARCAAAVEA